jgi:hypothetical protein
MPSRQLLPIVLSFAAPLLHAQYAAPPTAYTITQTSVTTGPATQIIYRNGAKAVLDVASAGDKPSVRRTVYDLQAHTSYSWDLSPAPVCGSGNFTGDWGDPFINSADANKDIASGPTTDAGPATIAGITVKGVEAAVAQQGKAKIWVEPKYGLILKLVFFPTAGPAQTMIEVKQVSFTAPPASVFIVPASCTLPGPTLPEDERILAETGGPAAADFVNATTAPVSANSCTVLYRVVQARSMRPVTTGFQVAIDKTVDVNHPASYTMGKAPMDITRSPAAVCRN